MLAKYLIALFVFFRYAGFIKVIITLWYSKHRFCVHKFRNSFKKKQFLQSGQCPETHKKENKMYTDRTGKVRKAVYFNNEDWKRIEEKAALCKLDTTKYIRKSVIQNYMVIYDVLANLK